MTSTELEDHPGIDLVRWIVALAVPGVALVCLPQLADSFSVPKATVAAVAAVAVLAAVAWRAAAWREISVPTGPVVWAMGAFLALAAARTITSPVIWRSFVGQRGRTSGLALYLVCALLLVAAARAFRDAAAVRRLTRCVLVACGGIALYVFVQAAGLDPVEWSDTGRWISTLGNSNFVSGYLGATLAVPVFHALDDDEERWWRLAGAGVAVLVCVAILLTRSFQGIPAGAASVATVGLIWAARRPRQQRRAISAAVVAGLASVAVLVGAGLAGAGPLDALRGETGFKQREYFWAAGIEMVADHPVAGLGFDLYGSYYREYRTPEAAALFGLAETTNEPHNVPLGMAVSGGVLLAVAYLAFVALVGLALVGGLRSGGARSLALGAVGGVWIGYQVQSLVSIDEPALTVLHWVFAGGVLGLTGRSGWRSIALPGRVVRSARGKRAATVVQAPSTTPVRAGVVAVAALLTWVVLVPLRADRHAGAVGDELHQGDLRGALKAASTAVEIAPWEATYWAEHGRVLAAAGDDAAAYERYAEAVRRDPRNLAHTINAARTAAASGRQEEATSHFERALELEPQDPELLAEVGRHFAAAGRAEDAVELLEEAVAGGVGDTLGLARAYFLAGRRDEGEALLQPILEDSSEIPLILKVADVYLAVEDFEAAEDVVDRALEIDDDFAQALLAKALLLERRGDITGAYPLIERAAPRLGATQEAQEALERIRARAAAEGLA